MSKLKCRLFQYYDDGEITPPSASSILPTSTGHPRTQPLRASQTEPVRHSGGGGGRAQQGTVQYNWLPQEIQMTGTTAYLEEKKKYNPRTSLGRSNTDRQVSKFRVCHLSRGTPPSPNFNCPVSARWLINPNTPTPTVSAAKVLKRPRQTSRQDTHPSSGSRRRPLAFKGGEAALSLPGSPRPGQPFSVNEPLVAKSSRVVQYPGGLRNTEPLIARNRKGGRRA